jgi:nucleoside-diphosphate-sugar epimerase
VKILVTGANGFVGKALCARLYEVGHQVVPAVRRTQRLRGEYVVGDIDNAPDWTISLQGCEVVVHLAARVHVMHEKATDSWAAFHRSNVAATLSLALQAAAAGVRRFVFLSSVKVNGEETIAGKVFTELDMPAPLDAYGRSKMEAEQGLLEMATNTGLEVVIIRLPLVYGPGVKGNFASLIKWIRSGVPLPLGDVHNRRSMIALDNLVSFIALCADSAASPNAKDQVFLVSDGEDISTTELLRRVAKAYGCRARLFSAPMRLMRMAAQSMGKASVADRLWGSLVVDDSKARQLLGWQPPSSMDEQLKKMALHDARV